MWGTELTGLTGAPSCSHHISRQNTHFIAIVIVIICCLHDESLSAHCAVYAYILDYGFSVIDDIILLVCTYNLSCTDAPLSAALTLTLTPTSTVLFCTVLYWTVLYCTVLYCTVLYCTVLRPSALPSFLPPNHNGTFQLQRRWD